MSEPAHPTPETPSEERLRPHIYDGIQEYDKRLPRWWLLTLYGAIVFSALYWAYYETYGIGDSPAKSLQIEMRENTVRTAEKSGVIDDEALWRMSADRKV